MLNLHGKWVLLAIALATMALTFWIRESAPSYQKCQANYQAERESEKQEENAASLFVVRVLAYRCTNRLIEGHKDAIIAVATVLLTIVTGFLVWVGYRQVTTTRAQLRAYVFVTPKSIDIMRSGEINECTVGYAIANQGQTPAYHVRTNIDIRIMKARLSSEFEVKPPGENPIPFERVINPGQSIEGTAVKPVKFDIDVLNKNAERLYIVGMISYIDAFGRPRKTRFCCAATNLDKSIRAYETTGKCIPITFQWSEQHNDAS
jgi:hypothetical protein